MDFIDFSECKFSNRHGRYGGNAGDKDGIIYNDEFWIIKYPKTTRSMQGNHLPIKPTKKAYMIFLNYRLKKKSID